MPAAAMPSPDLFGLDSNPLAFLVEDSAKFLKQHWEQAPVVFKASAERRALFAGLFNYVELQRLAVICEQEGEPLEFEVDVNAARYVDGKRETPNGELADAAAIERLYRQEGCTMQFHQPQRFSEELWRLLAALERQLGCLVGCNAYLTPKGTQGLAPHFDDVEIFVVQTQGSKRWRVYCPTPEALPGSLLAHCRLANKPSGDLAEEEIGEPSMEVTLEVGDVLYLPRGTIHQAVAQSEDSGHLTISTYQRWSAADLLQYTVSVALANPTLQPLLPAGLKVGLPPRFLSAASLDAGDALQLAVASGGFGEDPEAFDAPESAAAGGSNGAGSKAALARQLAAACRSMAECLEDPELGPRLLQTAADAMGEDFMRSRLPPHPDQLPERGTAPTLADSVQCIASGLFRLVPLNGADAHEREGAGCGAECEEDHDHEHAHAHEHGAACGTDCQEDQEQQHGEGSGAGFAAPPAWLRLVSCLENARDSHMLTPGGDDIEGGSGDDDTSSEDESDGDDAEPRQKQQQGRKRKQQEAGSDSEGEGSGSDEDDDGKREDLVFPAEFAPALVQLLGSAPDAAGRPVPVQQIALPHPQLQLQVAGSLWDAGVLRTVKAAAPQKVPKQQKQAGGKKAAGKADKKSAAPAAASGKNKAGGKAGGAVAPKPKKQKA